MQAQTQIGSKGLATIFQQQGNTPLISLQFWVQTGAMHESPHLGAGLSHLLEHMVFKGTRSYTGSELADKVSSLGGMWNAYTSSDRTVYHIDGPAQHWREFLHILHELVFYPSFPREEWEKERDVIRREMAMYDDDPQDISYRTLVETLYRAHPRRLPIIGYPQLFDALSYEDMVQYHQDHYTPEQVFVICSCGGELIDSSDFYAAMESMQADLQPRRAPRVQQGKEPLQWGARVERREFAQPTSTLMLAWRLPSGQHPDSPALALLSHILGSGRAAWLHALYHDEEGLAHDVSCSVIADRENEGAFVIETDCDREKRDELRDRLLSYIVSLPEQDGFELGIQRALAQLKTVRLRSLSSVQGRANLLGISWHHTRNIRWSEEWEQALNTVRAEDIKRVVQTYFVPHKCCEVSIDPLGSNGVEDTMRIVTEENPVTEQTLSSGLRLVTRRDKSVPMVHLSLAVGAGCGSETRENSGINSLLSECLLKGTHTRSSRDIADGLENRGSSIGSEAGNNTLMIAAQCLSEEFAYTLDVLADIILHPSLPEEAIETEKESMIADILDSEEDPLSRAFRRLRSLCFGETSYGLTPDGTQESVSALTRHDLVAQHARLFCGRNMVLSLVGDLPENTEELVDAALVGLTQGAAITRTATPAQQAGELFEPLDKEQTVITLALPGAPVHAQEETAQALILEWWRDMAGPLFTELREKRGLAYYVSAAAMSGVDAGCFYVYLGTAPEQLEEARSALVACLDELLEQGIAADVFERTRTVALVGHQMQSQSLSRMSKAFAIDTLLGLPIDHSLTLPARFESLTHEQVERSLRQLLRAESPRTWVIVGKEGCVS